MAGAEMTQMLDVQLRDVGFVEVGGQTDDGDGPRHGQVLRIPITLISCIAACHGIYWFLDCAEQRVSDVI